MKSGGKINSGIDKAPGSATLHEKQVLGDMEMLDRELLLDQEVGPMVDRANEATAREPVAAFATTQEPSEPGESTG
jgi:hypothetical protein